MESEVELEEIYEESPRAKEGTKDKSYWKQPLPGGLKLSGQSYKSSQIRSVNQTKIHKGPVLGPGRGHPPRVVKRMMVTVRKQGRSRKGREQKNQKDIVAQQQHLVEE